MYPQPVSLLTSMIGPVHTCCPISEKHFRAKANILPWRALEWNVLEMSVGCVKLLNLRFPPGCGACAGFTLILKRIVFQCKRREMFSHLSPLLNTKVHLTTSEFGSNFSERAQV